MFFLIELLVFNHSVAKGTQTAIAGRRMGSLALRVASGEQLRFSAPGILLIIPFYSGRALTREYNRQAHEQRCYETWMAQLQASQSFQS